MTRAKAGRWIAQLTLAGLLALAPVPAFADDDGDSSGGSSCGNACPIALGVIIGLTDVIFLGADLGYGVQGRWLPAGWAWTQTVWGSGHLLAALVMVPLGALIDDATWWGLGTAFGVVGTWFVTHGIISLVKHYTRPRRFRAERLPPPRPRYMPEVAFAPTLNGAHGVLAWRF